jgi:hypothetical protein
MPVGEAIDTLGLGTILTTLDAATRQVRSELIATVQAHYQRYEWLLQVERILSWSGGTSKDDEPPRRRRMMPGLIELVLHPGDLPVKIPVKINADQAASVGAMVTENPSCSRWRT